MSASGVIPITAVSKSRDYDQVMYAQYVTSTKVTMM